MTAGRRRQTPTGAARRPGGGTPLPGRGVTEAAGSTGGAGRPERYGVYGHMDVCVCVCVYIYIYIYTRKGVRQGGAAPGCVPPGRVVCSGDTVADVSIRS